MKNADKAREISNNYANSKLLLTPEECAAYTSAMIMAEWKDQQFAEEKEKWIEKVIGWIDYNNRNGGCWFDGWERDLKQTMGEL